jgi:ribonuclease P protein component
MPGSFANPIKMKFRKSERLCSRKSIGKLFAAGNVVFHYPFRVLWLDAGEGTYFPAKAAISVPRKRFKKAVDRNRIKRLVREAYRLNKEQLYDGLIQKGRNIEMIIVYIAGEEHEFNYINEKITGLFKKLLKNGGADQENI